MKYLNTACYVLVAASFFLINVQCTASEIAFQEESSLNPHNSYYQEWYAGIKVGGSGINIIFPNLNGEKSVVLDSVYFRRMKGKLVEGRSMYSSILKRPSKYYKDVSVYYKDDKTLNKQVDFPFNLKQDECVISYFEDGKKKFLKVESIKERKGLYYKDGPPLVLN